MKTREEALAFGLTFENTYREASFHDANWQLIRVKPIKKAADSDVCVSSFFHFQKHNSSREMPMSSALNTGLSPLALCFS